MSDEIQWKYTDSKVLKKGLLTLSDKLDMVDALSELLDNAFEYFPSDGKEMQISCSLEQDENEHPVFHFKQNSGGVPESDHSALFTAGMTGSSSNSKSGPSISTYGTGFGLALPAIGRYNIVRNYRAGENPIKWQMGDEQDENESNGGSENLPQNWYYGQNGFWGIPKWPQESIKADEFEEGVFHIESRKLTSKCIDFFRNAPAYKSAIEQLIKTYTRLILLFKQRDVDVQILMKNSLTADSTLTEIDLAELVSDDNIFSGNFEEIVKRSPYSFFEEQSVRFGLDYQEGDKVMSIDILIVNAQGTTDTESSAGYTLWGNERLFDINYSPPGLDKGNDTSMTKVTGNATTRRWKGYVHFTSEHSELIPWDGPVKWGFKEEVGNRACKFVNEILRVWGKSFAGKGKFSPDFSYLNDPSDELKLRTSVDLPWGDEEE
jgi:hypothetical protein